MGHTSLNDQSSGSYSNELQYEDNNELSTELCDEKVLKQRLLENDITYPVISCFITVLIPIYGFIAFFMNRHLNRNSPRYKWFSRALGLGSGLAVVYTFLLCAYVHHYHTHVKPDDVLGYSY